MSSHSRSKGARGENEVAKILTAAGYPCERNARNGISDEDLHHAIPGVYLEVKRAERLKLPEWWRQTREGARQFSCCGVYYMDAMPTHPLCPNCQRPWAEARDDAPVLLHRQNGGEWLATVRLADLCRWWKP